MRVGARCAAAGPDCVQVLAATALLALDALRMRMSGCLPAVNQKWAQSAQSVTNRTPLRGPEMPNRAGSGTCSAARREQRHESPVAPSHALFPLIQGQKFAPLPLHACNQLVAPRVVLATLGSHLGIGRPELASVTGNAAARVQVHGL